MMKKPIKNPPMSDLESHYLNQQEKLNQLMALPNADAGEILEAEYAMLQAWKMLAKMRNERITTE